MSYNCTTNNIHFDKVILQEISKSTRKEVQFKNGIPLQLTLVFKVIMALPDGEPIFTNTNIRLRSLVEKLDSNKSLVVLSINVFPLKINIRKNLIKKLLKKKIKTHFIFENIIASSKNDYDKVNNLIKLNDFINR